MFITFATHRNANCQTGCTGECMGTEAGGDNTWAIPLQSYDDDLREALEEFRRARQYRGFFDESVAPAGLLQKPASRKCTHSRPSLAPAITTRGAPQLEYTPIRVPS